MEGDHMMEQKGDAMKGKDAMKDTGAMKDQGAMKDKSAMKDTGAMKGQGGQERSRGQHGKALEMSNFVFFGSLPPQGGKAPMVPEKYR